MKLRGNEYQFAAIKFRKRAKIPHLLRYIFQLVIVKRVPFRARDLYGRDVDLIPSDEEEKYEICIALGTIFASLFEIYFCER